MISKENESRNKKYKITIKSEFKKRNIIPVKSLKIAIEFPSKSPFFRWKSPMKIPISNQPRSVEVEPAAMMGHQDHQDHLQLLAFFFGKSMVNKNYKPWNFGKNPIFLVIFQKMMILKYKPISIVGGTQPFLTNPYIIWIGNGCVCAL